MKYPIDSEGEYESCTVAKDELNSMDISQQIKEILSNQTQGKAMNISII